MERSTLAQAGGWLNHGDPLRIAGAVAVVLIHVTTHGVAQFGGIPRGDWWLCLLVESACRWAVPVFVMLSGALLLDPAKDEPLRRFIARRLSRVGVPLVFWTIFYLGWRIGYLDREPGLNWILQSVAFGQPYAHLFFLYLLVGLYAVTPLLRGFLASASPRRQGALLALLFALGIGDKLIRTAWPTGLSGLLLFVPYLGYYLLGYRLREVVLSRRAYRSAWLVVGFATVVIALGTRLMFTLSDQPAWRYWPLEYLTPQLVIQSAAVYLILATRFRATAGSPTLRYLGAASLGVYLIHPALLSVMRDHGLTPTWHGAWVGIPITAVIAGLGALAITAVLLALPLVRRVVGG